MEIDNDIIEEINLRLKDIRFLIIALFISQILILFMLTILFGYIKGLL